MSWAILLNGMLSHLIRLFLPHHTNNHRAHLLHPVSILIFLGFFTSLQLLASFVPNLIPLTLGVTNINPQKVIEITNKERSERGLRELKQDPLLSKAAETKAADMISRNYWAHNAPDGTTPWFFFKEVGYTYRYAGENLARDFQEPEEVVKAWINSPSHKENLFSQKYEEIGIAVVEGDLKGTRTVLVVQLFGTKLNSTSAALGTPPEEHLPLLSELVQGKSTQYLSQVASLFSLTQGLGVFILAIFVIIFTLDLIIIKSKNISRSTSRSGVHLFFLVIMILGALALKAGTIL